MDTKDKDPLTMQDTLPLKYFASSTEPYDVFESCAEAPFEPLDHAKTAMAKWVGGVEKCK